MHHESDENSYSDTAVLYVACQKKNKDLVDFLLAAGADPNADYSLRAVWGNESTPCLLAAVPAIEIVKALLQKGADPNIPDWVEGHPRSVVGFASGTQELIDLLKQDGARLRSDEE
ncbi:MAG: hypothetical protein QOJ64_4328 [Acidobacteriota bacterium]|jgi:ankyrin repeat protein|nr:hypothetical protein [Acidobacteriota bacterium]